MVKRRNGEALGGIMVKWGRMYWFVFDFERRETVLGK